MQQVRCHARTAHTSYALKWGLRRCIDGRVRPGERNMEMEMGNWLMISQLQVHRWYVMKLANMDMQLSMKLSDEYQAMAGQVTNFLRR